MQEVFNKYINYLQAEKGASAYTVRNYTNDLLGNYKRGPEKGFFQFLMMRKIDSLAEVDRNVLRDYIAWLMDRGVVKPSIARKLSAIRSFYRYLSREEILSANPLEKFASPKADKRLPSFLSVEETIKLLQAPNLATPEGQRDRALLELLYASGLRVSELVSLNLEQVNLDTNEIRVRGKGLKERVVLIGQPAARALQTYISQSRNKSLGGKRNTALFLNPSGERLPARRVQKILGKYAHSASIDKRVYPHLLRHTFATHLLDGGADLRVVQELLGHADLSSTQIYTHLSQSQARKVYLSAHPLAQKKEKKPFGTHPPDPLP